MVKLTDDGPRLARRRLDRAATLHDIAAVLAEQDLSLVSIQTSADDNSNTATIQLGVEIHAVLVHAKLHDRSCRVAGIGAGRCKSGN